jgi:phenylalanyl-tRNA synthetase beta subunit
LNPEAVFVVFGSNDYSDNLNKSSFDLENYAGEKNRRIWLKDFLLRFQLPKFVFVKFQHNLVFLEILNKFGLYELSDNLRDYRHGLDIAESQEYYEYTFSIIRKFKELCQRNNTEFLMIIMPLEKDYQEKDKWQSNNGIVKMVEFLEKEQIKYLNPCQVLFEARKRYSKEECFNFGCRAGHLTKLGHQEFAKILFQYIKDNF